MARISPGDTVWARILVVCAASIAAGGLVWGLVATGRRGFLIDYAAPWFTVMTAFAAALIWWGQREDRRLARLARRLTVRFMDGDEEVDSVSQAYLPHEADARQLAQQIGRQRIGGHDFQFAADKINVRRRGEEVALSGEDKTVYTIEVDIPLTDRRQADEFRWRRKLTEEPADAHEAAKLDQAGNESKHLKLFVACGEVSDTAAGYEVMQLPMVLGPDLVASVAERVKNRLARASSAEILVKGPIVLGVALGQVLAHVPCRIDYLQLDQSTKRTSAWWSNTRMK